MRIRATEDEEWVEERNKERNQERGKERGKERGNAERREGQGERQGKGRGEERMCFAEGVAVQIRGHTEMRTCYASLLAPA